MHLDKISKLQISFQMVSLEKQKTLQDGEKLEVNQVEQIFDQKKPSKHSYNNSVVTKQTIAVVLYRVTIFTRYWFLKSGTAKAVAAVAEAPALS